MSTPAPDKASLRREMIARRAATENAWRSQASSKIEKYALALPEMLTARNVAVYATKGAEVETADLIAGVIQRVGGVLLPRITDAGDLEFRRVEAFPLGLIRGAFGILEPDPSLNSPVVALAQIDLMFLPGAVFDAHGGRIGYGKGHYDKFLAPPHFAKKFGLCFALQLTDRIPTQAHDVSLDGVITENGVIRVQL